MSRRDGERGAALLTVLMLVAIIAVMAGTALEKMRLSTRLAGNAAAGEQARAYAYAAETLALTRIDAQLGQKPDRVSLAGGWSGRPFGLPLPGGLAVARVSDGGNCFNLNGLVGRSGPGTYVADANGVEQFARLMKLLGISGQVAAGIAAASADWIDSDDTALPGGAEDNSYTGRDVAYRTPNTLIADPSELRAVAGMTPDIYATVRPWVCALPTAQPTRINIDTLLPEQAPLVAMLSLDTVSVAAARAAILKRPPEGYGDTSEFWRSITQAGASPGGAEGQTSVLTEWFTLDVDVTLGDVDLHETGTIDATRLPARLVSRQWGEAS